MQPKAEDMLWVAVSGCWYDQGLTAATFGSSWLFRTAQGGAVLI